MSSFTETPIVLLTAVYTFQKSFPRPFAQYSKIYFYEKNAFFQFLTCHIFFFTKKSEFRSINDIKMFSKFNLQFSLLFFVGMIEFAETELLAKFE
jgi:hypothetical protein